MGATIKDFPLSANFFAGAGGVTPDSSVSLAGLLNALYGMPNMGRGTRFFVDPINGADANSGLSPEKALKTIAAAHGLCTANSNDVVYLLPGISGNYNYLTETLVWSKDYTHLIGVVAPTPVGQRARIANASEDIVTLLSITANGCIFSNFLVGQFGSDAAALGCVDVTGQRSYFNNVNIQGMGNATPAAENGAYSLKLNGAAETEFANCVIGLDTAVRAGDNAELLIDGGCKRISFKDCRFISYSETSTKVMVKLADTSALDRYMIFDSCLFYNFSTNHANTLAEAFSIPASPQTHDIILKGECLLVGIDEWESNDRGTIWIGNAPPTQASSGIAVEPVT